MSVGDRISLSGMGYDGFTPYYNIMLDYGPAFQAAADAFMADATSLCPVDTGFLLSTIGSSSDSEGMDAWADAEYAIYVNEWSGFFDVGFNSALAVADAVCNAIWVDGMVEEYELILTEREEVLAEIQQRIDEKEQERAEKEAELEQAENDLQDAEEEMEAEEEEGGGGGGGFAAFLVALLIEMIMTFIEEVFKLEEERTSYENEYTETESYYDDILGHY